MGVNSKLPPRTELNFCFETLVPPKGGDLILVNSAVNPPPFFSGVRCQQFWERDSGLCHLLLSAPAEMHLILSGPQPSTHGLTS